MNVVAVVTIIASPFKLTETAVEEVVEHRDI